jgi:hypothetical protein
MHGHSVCVMEVFLVKLSYVNVISTFCKGSQQMALYSCTCSGSDTQSVEQDVHVIGRIKETFIICP